MSFFCVAGAVTRSNYHAVLHLINEEGIPGVKSDQNHLDKRILTRETVCSTKTQQA